GSPTRSRSTRRSAAAGGAGPISPEPRSPRTTMRTRPPLRALTAAGLAAALAALSACGGKPDAPSPAAVTPQNVTLTSAQLQHIRLVQVSESDVHRTVEVPGVVDFDNDQSTSVTAPMTGLVTRLLVQPGQPVAA